jgi:hypothetical protein
MVFAFDGGQQLSEHTTPYDALVQVVDGEAEITIAGKPHRLRAGDMIVMPAHQPHAVVAVSPQDVADDDPLVTLAVVRRRRGSLFDDLEDVAIGVASQKRAREANPAAGGRHDIGADHRAARSA